MLPILLAATTLNFRLADHLHDDLRQTSSKAVILACEQVASIRTIASLRRENGIQDKFCQMLDSAMKPALIYTLKSSAVGSINF